MMELENANGLLCGHELRRQNLVTTGPHAVAWKLTFCSASWRGAEALRGDIRSTWRREAGSCGLLSVATTRNPRMRHQAPEQQNRFRLSGAGNGVGLDETSHGLGRRPGAHEGVEWGEERMHYTSPDKESCTCTNDSESTSRARPCECVQASALPHSAPPTSSLAVRHT